MGRNACALSTASPKNHALMKQLGADVVYDYNVSGARGPPSRSFSFNLHELAACSKDPETPGLIKRWSEGKIAHALDAVADQGTHGHVCLADPDQPVDSFALVSGSTRLCAQAFGDEGGKLITLGKPGLSHNSRK